MIRTTFLFLVLFGGTVLADEPDAWERLLQESQTYLELRQNQLMTEFDLSKHERYDLDPATGTLVFSNAGKPSVVANVQIVGSFSTRSQTWLWAWANSSIDPQLYGDLESVTRFGQQKNFSRLTDPKWRGKEADGWSMAAVTVFLLKAKGAYSAPSGHLRIFMVITDIAWVPG